jgi:hypothetical protein
MMKEDDPLKQTPTCELDRDSRLLKKALELGDRQADELARLSLASVRYRSAIWRALHQARFGNMSRVIETLEKGLEYGDKTKSDGPRSNVHQLDPGRAPQA